MFGFRMLKNIWKWDRKLSDFSISLYKSSDFRVSDTPPCHNCVIMTKTGPVQNSFKIAVRAGLSTRVFVYMVIKRQIDNRNRYSGMLKSERSDFRQRRNLNEMVSQSQTFGRLVRSIFRFELLSTLLYRTKQKMFGLDHWFRFQT